MGNPKVTRIAKESAPARDWGWLKMPEDDRGARQLESSALTVIEGVKALVVRDEESLALANSFVVRIAEIKAGIKEKKELLLSPIKKLLVRPMEEFFRMVEKPLLAEDERLRNSIIRYRMEKIREEEELHKILRGGEEDGGIPEPLGAFSPATMEVENGKVGTTEVWKHQVLDVEAIPHDILVAACRTKRGEEALDQAIRGQLAGGVRKIAGVKIFKSETLTVTAYNK